MLDLDQPVHMYLDVSIVCPTDEGMVNLGHFHFFKGLPGLFIRDLLDLEEGFLNAISATNHSDGAIGGVLGLWDGDLGGRKALQLLMFRAINVGSLTTMAILIKAHLCSLMPLVILSIIYIT